MTSYSCSTNSIDGPKLELSLKTKDLPQEAHTLRLDNIEIGQKYTGRVTSIAKYGLFIKLDKSMLKGLCHKSDMASSDEGKYKVGDAICVTLISVKDKRINFSLKSAEEVQKTLEKASKQAEEKDKSSVDHEMPTLPETIEENPLDVMDFTWDQPQSNTQDASGSSSEDEEHSGPSLSRKDKRKKLLEKEAEAQLAESQQDKLPDSAEEYEKLLFSSPNNSFYWIKYIAFELQLGEVDKARSIAERAIKQIQIQDQNEKLNVWIAYLNLENAFGTPESLEQCFQRAAQFNDAKTVYLQMCLMLQGAGKMDEAEEYYEKMVKKFKESCKVWVAFGQFYMQQKRTDQVRKVLERSLKSLPKRKRKDSLIVRHRREY